MGVSGNLPDTVAARLLCDRKWFLELEEVPMTIVGALDVHRRQLTFDYLDSDTGEVARGRVVPGRSDPSAPVADPFRGS